MRQPPEGVEPSEDPAGWGLKKQHIALHEGVNVIEVKKGGLAYVSYFDDDSEHAPRVVVHFPTGTVNGFFDAAKHTKADWDRLLDQAVSPILHEKQLILVLDHDANLPDRKLRRSKVLALHKTTGGLIWETARPHSRGAWSTPMIWTHEHGTHLVVLGDGLFRP